MSSVTYYFLKQKTGICGVQTLGDQKEFRIAVTGTVLATDATSQVMKKLKLIGYPFKIEKKTCFIEVSWLSCLFYVFTFAVYSAV